MKNSYMNQEELKQSILDLWTAKYHGPKDYLYLLTDTYFNSDHVVYHIEDNKIVATIMGIPFDFGYGEKKLKGLFLFGLVTEDKYRRQGIMTRLLQDINLRAQQHVDFTFLIPISDLNADFYRKRGYFNSFFLLEQRYTSVHDFYYDLQFSLFDKDERIKDLKEKLYKSIQVKVFDDHSGMTPDSIISFLESQEKKARSSVNLVHTKKDWSIILIKNRMNDDAVFVAFDKDNDICGVAFIEKKEMKRLLISAIYIEDECTYYALLNHIKRSYPDFSLSVYATSDNYSSPAIMEKIYGAQNLDGGETLFGLLETQFDVSKLLEPHGMVRLLRFENILKYLAYIRKDVEFKLCIRDWENDDPEKKSVFIIKNGSLKVEQITATSLKKDKSILYLSQKEVSEILFRKKDKSSLIMDAFGIPGLNLEMGLTPT